MNKDIQGLIYGSSILSVIGSVIIFFQGKKDLGIFIGLWAPTILAWGAFYNSETVATGKTLPDAA